MKNEYARAFLEILNEGTPVETALTGLRAALEKKHHTKLFAPTLLEVLRTLEAEKGGKQAVVTVAKGSDTTALEAKIKAALDELGVTKDTPVKEVVDETLIGGFVATFDYQEHDQSYKKALTNLYESITK
jgi:F0F1-type ATP synthase delta subunit